MDGGERQAYEVYCAGNYAEVVAANVHFLSPHKWLILWLSSDCLSEANKATVLEEP